MTDTTTTAEGQAMIAALRQQLAEAQSKRPDPAPIPLTPGDQIHFLRSGLTFRTSDEWAATVISQRGMVATVTSDLIEASRDRYGRSWLALVDDPEAQIARWGSVTFARGAFPAGVPTWTPATPEEEAARDLSHDAAWSLPEGPERAAALREHARVFGRPQTSRTMAEES